MQNAPVILLAEDNEADVMLFRHVMGVTGIGCQLQVVEDGDRAVAYFAGSGPFANRQAFPLPVVAVLDVMLPRRSGLEVLAWARNTTALRRLPVIMLSSSYQDREIAAAYDLGANSYLVKPIALDAITRMITNILTYWVTLNHAPRDMPNLV